jgi:para-aminobenzoate synthetase / 4-amino-4-deoxychorismate lyase
MRSAVTFDEPFVLFDDARTFSPAPARLYTHPEEVLIARTGPELHALLSDLREEKRHVAGFLSYEAGHVLEPRLAKMVQQPDLPLAWFGVFKDYQEVAPEDLAALLPDPAGGWLGPPQPRCTFTDYAATFDRVKDWIEAGDIYQANLTMRADVATQGHPLALYAGLRARAKAGYGGVVWTGEDWLLSLSPELFFAAQDGKVTTRPMKGTAARQGDAQRDDAVRAQLSADPKQRAENLMIVDLLRNDLSRIAAPGTVQVPELFRVESYPTVHTMTSTITAQIAGGLDVVDVLESIYPCGSITGAPKIRAMEIIAAVEQEARGIYTGSIGRIDPPAALGQQRCAAFNVAIRTLHLREGQSCATLGLGGGIVADSKRAEEWQECLDKGAFVADQRRFDLIETMRFEPDQGIMLLERHLERIKESARTFGFPFDRHATRNALQSATFRLHDAQRIRLMLSDSGAIAIEAGPLAPAPTDPVCVAVVPLPVATDDFRLCHKMTDRAFYAEARTQSGTFEVILVREDGLLTEGSFTNLFVERHGKFITPPLALGLLPGVLRAEMIENGQATEGELRLVDLAGGFMIGNASRGLIRAVLAG